ncbi:MAG: NUDIX domain-containing protein [Anaerolineales bacterium]|nr:NUDIX domain-containing protein [Anaerolineales bacterium]
MEHKPWKTLNSTIVFEQQPWLRILAEDVQLPDGRIVKDYLRLITPDFVAIVPINPNGEIGLIRCYKNGPQRVDIQPPSGYIEEGEEPREAAIRELLEETGCVAENWHSLGSYVLAGNRGGGLGHILLATGCEQVAEPNPDDLEEQEVLWLQKREVNEKLKKGAFAQISTVAALSLALAHLEAEDATSQDMEP